MLTIIDQVFLKRAKRDSEKAAHFFKAGMIHFEMLTVRYLYQIKIDRPGFYTYFLIIYCR